MQINIITLFPKMIEGFINESILKKAQEKELIKFNLIDLRQYAIDKYKTVDDRPYGGGAGMVLMVEPIYKAIKAIKQPNKVVLTSAKGQLFDQTKAIEYSKLNQLTIICGHYEGVDERVLKYVNEEISIGPYIMTGGEIAAATMADAVCRLLPGVLKKQDAAGNESFMEININELIKIVGPTEKLIKLKEQGKKAVQLLEYPHYTRPADFQGHKTPEILLSGDHKKIWKWRIRQAYKRTIDLNYSYN